MWLTDYIQTCIGSITFNQNDDGDNFACQGNSATTTFAQPKSSRAMLMSMLPSSSSKPSSSSPAASTAEKACVNESEQSSQPGEGQKDIGEILPDLQGQLIENAIKPHVSTSSGPNTASGQQPPDERPNDATTTVEKLDEPGRPTTMTRKRVRKPKQRPDDEQGAAFGGQSYPFKWNHGVEVSLVHLGSGGHFGQCETIEKSHI